jgi:polyisoprenoid-binding protein YceI
VTRRPCPLALSLVVFGLSCAGPAMPEDRPSTPSAPSAPEDADEIVRPSDQLPDEDDAPASPTEEPGGPTPPPPDGGNGGSDDDTNSTTTDDDAPPAPVAPLFAARSSADDSLLYTLVWRDPRALGNGFAHDHVVRATNWAGTLQFRVGDAAACFVDIDVETAALLNDEPSMREEVGMDSDISDSDRETVRTTMLGEDQLDAEGHPTLTFTSTACRGDLDGNGTLEIDGDLTIRGVTNRVVWPVTYRVTSDGRMFAQGNLTIAQTDFGITPYSAFFGAVRVADDVDLVFDLVGQPTTD